MTMPSLFLSHGAPTLAIAPSPTADFLADLGARIPAPTAILAVSAHWQADRPTASRASAPRTIHDFGGFPDALYRILYQAPGAPDLAKRAVALLEDAGIAAGLDADRGLDHGTWVPLHLIYPAADVPVVQLSLVGEGGPADHLAIGRALAPLHDDKVLVLGSGGAVHNLRAWFSEPGGPPPDWAVAFDDWLCHSVDAGAVDELVGYRAGAPHGALAHPTEEHLLPLFVALGAGGGGPGRVLHRAFDGSLSMAAFAFG